MVMVMAIAMVMAIVVGRGDGGLILETLMVMGWW